MQDRVWEELGRIDYFLDHLARAVERGEVPASSYDRLAPRYLERRAELAQIISIRSGEAAAAAAPAAAAPAAAPAPAFPRTSGDRAAEASVVQAGEYFLEQGEGIAYPKIAQPRPSARPSRPNAPLPPPPARVTPPRPARPTPPPREPIAASTWLAYVGALLVVIAAAIFTVYNWESFSPEVKLAALVAVTLVFYAGGESVRVVLKLPVIGVALLGVGSAMLLFDGWMLLSALRLTGAMPWAVVLLVCSAVYWLTELRVAGRWFGAIGGVAQVAWWWLLGRGLGWTPMPTFAVLAAVALAWALLGARTPRTGPLETLGSTLRAGGPLLAAVTAAASLAVVAQGVSVRAWGYPQLAEAAAVAVLAAVAIELTPAVRPLSPLALLPALPAAAALRFLAPATWPAGVALLAALALACAAYAVVRGGAPYAAAAVVASLAAPALAPPSAPFDGVLVAYALLALGWLAAGSALRRFRHGDGAVGALLVWENASPLIEGVTALLAFGSSVELGMLGSPGYPELARLVLVAVLAAATIEWRATGVGVSAAALLPALSAVLAVHLASPATWPADVAVLVVLSLICAAYAVWRGRGGYALAAVVLSVAAPVVGPPGGRLEALVAIVAAVALAWLAVSRLLEGRAFGSAPDAAAAWDVAGVIVLTAASVAVPLVTGVVPLLTPGPITGWHAILGGAMPLAWLLAFVLRPRRELAWAVYVTSGYAVLTLLAFAAPGWPPARYAAVLLLFAVAWAQAEPLPERLLGLEGGSVVAISEVLLAALPVAGIVATLARYASVRSWDVVALLAAAAAAWLLEGVRRDGPRSFAIAAGLAVAAAADAAAVGIAVASAPIAAAATALVLAGAVALLPPLRPRGSMTALAAALVASATLPAAFASSGDLALALAVLAAAWAAVTFAAEVPEVSLAAALLASGAGFAALDRFHGVPAATLAFGIVAAAALLAPTTFADRTSADAFGTRAARALAAAGLVVLLFLAGLGTATGLDPAGLAWWQVGWQGLALALAVLGGYVLLWSGLEDVEVGAYAGTGLFVLAYWVALLGRHVGQAELFLVPAALYAVAMGYLWASRGPGREVPELNDAAAVVLGVVAPFALSLTSFGASASFTHGMWALVLATVAVLAGLALRVRAYFLGGLAVAALDALWLSRDWLFALPKWLLIGTLGIVMIAVGLGYARHQAMMGEAAARVRDALADWR